MFFCVCLNASPFRPTLPIHDACLSDCFQTNSFWNIFFIRFWQAWKSRQAFAVAEVSRSSFRLGNFFYLVSSLWFCFRSALRLGGVDKPVTIWSSEKRGRQDRTDHSPVMAIPRSAIFACRYTARVIKHRLLVRCARTHGGGRRA